MKAIQTAVSVNECWDSNASISVTIQATLIPQLSGQQPKQTSHHRRCWPYPWCHSRQSMPLGLEIGYTISIDSIDWMEISIRDSGCKSSNDKQTVCQSFISFVYYHQQRPGLRGTRMYWSFQLLWKLDNLGIHVEHFLDVRCKLLHLQGAEIELWS